MEVKAWLQTSRFRQCRNSIFCVSNLKGKNRFLFRKALSNWRSGQIGKGLWCSRGHRTIHLGFHCPGGPPPKNYHIFLVIWIGQVMKLKRFFSWKVCWGVLQPKERSCSTVRRYCTTTTFSLSHHHYIIQKERNLLINAELDTATPSFLCLFCINYIMIQGFYFSTSSTSMTNQWFFCTLPEYFSSSSGFVFVTYRKK